MDEQEMIYCTECGTKNPAGNQFCSNCSARIGDKSGGNPIDVKAVLAKAAPVVNNAKAAISKAAPVVNNAAANAKTLVNKNPYLAMAAAIFIIIIVLIIMIAVRLATYDEPARASISSSDNADVKIDNDIAELDDDAKLEMVNEKISSQEFEEALAILKTCDVLTTGSYRDKLANAWADYYILEDADYESAYYVFDKVGVTNIESMKHEIFAENIIAALLADYCLTENVSRLKLKRNVFYTFNTGKVEFYDEFNTGMGFIAEVETTTNQHTTDFRLIYGEMLDCQDNVRVEYWTDNLVNPQTRIEQTMYEVNAGEFNGMVYDNGLQVNRERIDDLFKSGKLTQVELMNMVPYGEY